MTPPIAPRLSGPDRARLLLLDHGLSETARVLGLYIASFGDWQEIAFDDPGAEHCFARILQGSPSRDTIRRHLRQLMVHGYIESKPGGRGHSQRYRIDRVGKNAYPKLPGRGGLQGGLADKKASPYPSGTSSSSSAGARTNGPTTDDLGRLRALLGSHAAAVDEFRGSAKHPPNWATNLWSKYRYPGDSQETFWRGVDPDRIPGILATAMSNYATDAAGTPYAVRYFLSFLRTARDEPEGKPSAGSPRPAAGSEAAAVAADRRHETPGGSRRHRPAEQTGLTLLGVIAGGGPGEPPPESAAGPRQATEDERIREWEEAHPAERDRLRAEAIEQVARETRDRAFSKDKLRQLGAGMYRALVLQQFNSKTGKVANE